MKWSNEQLKEAVENSKTFTQVCRYLKAKDTGGSYFNIRSRVLKLKLDISHFDKSHFCRAKPSFNRQTSEYYLVLDENRTDRQKGAVLMRSLLEIGREYKCEICKNTGIWNNQKLDLEVDHINGNWKDNRQENLRFLCPNCHSQITKGC